MNFLSACLGVCLFLTRTSLSTEESPCTRRNSSSLDIREEVTYNWSDFTLHMLQRSDYKMNYFTSPRQTTPSDSLASVSVSRDFRYFIESMMDPCVRRVTVNVIPPNICYMVDAFAMAFDKSIYTSSCNMYWLSSLTMSDARLTVVNDTLASSAFNLARLLLNHFTFKSLNVRMNILYSSAMNTLTASSVDRDIELHKSNVTGQTGTSHRCLLLPAAATCRRQPSSEIHRIH